MIEPIEMNVDFSTQDTEMNVEADMNCKVEIPLPIASATTLGGIKVGENLSITEDGTLSALENALITDSAEGAIASFPDGGDGFAVRDLKVQMEPIQDLHGYDHPWTGGAGKNLFGGTYNTLFPLHFDSNTTVTATADTRGGDGNIRVYFYDENKQQIDWWGLVLGTGALTGRDFKTFEYPSTAYYVGFLGTESTNYQIEVNSTATAYEPYSNICPISGRTGVTVTRTGKNLFGGTFNKFFPLHFESDKTVIASADAVGSDTPQIGFYDENKVRIDYWGMDSAHSSVSGRVARVIELPKESYYVKFIGDESTRYMIEFGNTNTTFESYVGNTYNITFPSEAGTVYGGTLDVTTGVLTVDRASVTLDGSNDEPWGNYASNYGGYRLEIPDSKIDGVPKVQLKSNMYVGADSRSVTYPIIMGLMETYLSPSDDKYVFFTTDITTKADWLTWLGNNNVELTYPLANPVTVQLTPQQMTTLLGQNNVWSDADSVSVDYVADTKLYIAKVIADALS